MFLVTFLYTCDLFLHSHIHVQRFTNVLGVEYRKYHGGSELVRGICCS